MPEREARSNGIAPEVCELVINGNGERFLSDVATYVARHASGVPLYVALENRFDEMVSGDGIQRVHDIGGAECCRVTGVTALRAVLAVATEHTIVFLGDDTYNTLTDTSEFETPWWQLGSRRLLGAVVAATSGDLPVFSYRRTHESLAVLGGEVTIRRWYQFALEARSGNDERWPSAV